MSDEEITAASRRSAQPRTKSDFAPAAGVPGTRKPQNISELERWLSIGGGAALALGGLSRGRLAGLLATGLGASLLYRGMSGHCMMYEALGIDTAYHKRTTGVPAGQGIKMEKSLTVNVPPEELFSFWRNVENLPRVMSHLKSVRSTGENRSHWVAEGPMGMEPAWDAEIFNERENELIAWRSLQGGDVETAGSVRFERLPHDRGTALHLSLKFNPPAGRTGEMLASLVGDGFERRVEEDLRDFKRMMETGETPTVAGQPSGSYRRPSRIQGDGSPARAGRHSESK